MLVEQDSETCVKVAEHPKIDALFGILLPYTRIFISYNQYSGMLRHLKATTILHCHHYHYFSTRDLAALCSDSSVQCV